MIEGVRPEIDGGRFPAKRVVGEAVVVEADVFADGHDVLAARLRYRRADDDTWLEVPMEPLVNDRWRAEFRVDVLGRYVYTLCGWVDAFETWRRDTAKKIQAGQDVCVELLMGAELVESAAGRAASPDAEALAKWAARLRSEGMAMSGPAMSDELAYLMARYPDRQLETAYPLQLEVVVDSPRARFSTWYEMFPRSAASEPGRHGTFADVEKRLDYVASMGFDVLYLPPIHPIGGAHRKGKNNAPQAEPGEPGSPWAIGSDEGGHKSIHPELGRVEDFERLVERARERGIEVALDIAYQCSPDHPYVREHPEWFRHRPDGTIQYAENPPKKYQDIYPIEFDNESWAELWEELRDVVVYWIERGVRIFRVDNPHTKPFAFWEWMIDDVRRRWPDVVFLSEAFTRPKVMYRLAKLGFNQSYTYFAWRNAAWELREYFTELTTTEVADYFRPSLWPNTPDILTEYLQTGGRPAFFARLILAATLGASYGVYGPAFELCEATPREPGSEEYLNSEKYEIRHRDLDAPHSLAELIARVNAIRHANPALHADRSLRFHDVDNPELVAYSKATDDGSNVILTVVNVDPHNVQSGWVSLDLSELGVKPDEQFQVHDLITDSRYVWQGSTNFVELNPHVVPGHILHVRSSVRNERDYEHFV